MDEELLIGCGSHFRNKQGIVSIHKGLMLSGVVGMDGMPHLMDKGRHVPKILMIVQKDIRLCVIGSRGVRTASLSFVLININPAVFHTFSENGKIFFP